ncbi:hypothetical protein AAG906_003176 [Vitis piasezkii]
MFKTIPTCQVQMKNRLPRASPGSDQQAEVGDTVKPYIGDSVLNTAGTEIEKTEKEAPKEKAGASDDLEPKEVEMDDWLFGFTQLFRTHVGIDPDVHIDLHELGMELCSEALEETMTRLK